MTPQEMVDHLRSLELEIREKPYTNEEFKSAWHKVCTKHHPDHGGDPEKFKAATHAYKMLTSEAYRETQAAVKRAEENLDVMIQIDISFAMAFFGCRQVLHYGKIEAELLEQNDPTPGEVKSYEYDYNILPLVFTVRPGIKSGEMIQIQDKGFKSRDGGQRGVCTVSVKVREGLGRMLNDRDIMTVQPVPLDVMITGGDIEVKTMWGLKTLSLKPGTTPGTSATVGMWGAPTELGGNPMGHHVVQITPVYPTEKDLKTNPVWQKLGIVWNEEMAKNQRNNIDLELEDVWIRLNR